MATDEQLMLEKLLSATRPLRPHEVHITGHGIERFKESLGTLGRWKAQGILKFIKVKHLPPSQINPYGHREIQYELTDLGRRFAERSRDC